MAKLTTTVRNIGIFIMLLIVSAACDSSNSGDIPPVSVPPEESHITVSNDVEALSSRIEIVNGPLSQEKGYKALSQPKVVPDEDHFTLLVNTKPPVTPNGDVLSVTGVEIRGAFIFVSYHVQGKAYGGAVEVFNVSDPQNPKILSQIMFDDADINDVFINEDLNTAWVAGERNLSTSGYNTKTHKGAIVAKIPVSDNQMSAEITEAPLASTTGNAVVENGNFLYVSTGPSGGGVYQLDKVDLVVKGQFALDNITQIDRWSDYIVAFKGGAGAAVYRYNFDTQKTETIDTGLDIVAGESTNFVEQEYETTFIAMGSQGVRGYEFGKADTLFYEFSGMGSDLVYAMSADSKCAYIANGSAGLIFTYYPAQGETEAEPAAQWDNGRGPATYVKANGKYIVLANSTGGLSILRVNITE